LVAPIVSAMVVFRHCARGLFGREVGDGKGVVVFPESCEGGAAGFLGFGGRLCNGLVLFGCKLRLVTSLDIVRSVLVGRIYG
jgi:hypothetical protein